MTPYVLVEGLLYFEASCYIIKVRMELACYKALESSGKWADFKQYALSEIPGKSSFNQTHNTDFWI